MADKPKKRDSWGSKLGIILAVAGSAVGLGNFLRFPTQAVQNGGGAFMIPYFISLLLLGIPLMWIEWAIGRYGGVFGHGTGPGALNALWRNRFIKYFGVIGIFGPLIIFIYYTYIESWLLGYTFFSLTPVYAKAALAGQSGFKDFLSGYQGIVKNEYFHSIVPAYTFFLITFLANFTVIKKGISGGIEWVSKIAMPILVIAGIAVMIRVVTLPALVRPDWNMNAAFGFFWNPDFSALLNPQVWLAAAGQIFFTLSVGIGVIITYASYLKKDDDVVLSGLTAVSANEFCEVILGGSIVIPAAFVFFGGTQALEIAKSGAFNLGFVTMPLIFSQIQFGHIFAFLWFLLLFLAGITSSISLIQPAVAFLEDEFSITRDRAITWLAGVTFVLCQPAIFFLSRGVVDEMDFWGGTFCLVLFGTIEVIVFTWLFGMDKAWKEIHLGSDFKIPIIYKYIMKYITPVFLLAILGSWLYQNALPTFLMHNVALADRPYVLATRVGMILGFVVLSIMVNIAWKLKGAKRKKR
jgi:SNF family Na+-dependent transporter